MKTKNINQTLTAGVLEPERFENGKALIIAGPKGRFTAETRSGIPELWARLAAHLGRLPVQVGKVAYGVCFCGDEDAFEYLAGMEVSDPTGLPPDFQVTRIPAQPYAVFRHEGHVSKLCETMDAIQNQWQPRTSVKLVEPPAGGPHCFERYGEKFDPRTGVGDIEVWIPVEKSE